MRAKARGVPLKENRPLARFAQQLLQKLRAIELPSDLTSEQDLERRVLIPLAARIAAAAPPVRLFVHPIRNRQCCHPDCERARADGGRVQLGCPRCWRTSKPLWSVAVFGTHHTFDLVAADDHERLALEAKLVSARAARMPNGEIQRFFGQCALAASKHPRVIGVLISRGPFKAKWHADTAATEAWFARLGVQLVIREAPGTAARRATKRSHTAPDGAPNRG
jgi:hypothetical protein